jgi:hypothetical protein
MLGAAPPSDGAHDFDFNFGTWHTHIRRLLHPLSGSNTWVTYDGTVSVRKVWGGAANVEEIEANGSNRLELLNVRTIPPRINGALTAQTVRTGRCKHRRRSADSNMGAACSTIRKHSTGE